MGSTELFPLMPSSLSVLPLIHLYIPQHTHTLFFINARRDIFTEFFSKSYFM